MSEISLRNLPELDESNRNNTLYSRACSYKARGMNDYEMEEAIRRDNKQNFVEPLPESELKGLIKSASKMEQGVPYRSNYNKKSSKAPDIESVFNNVVEINEGLSFSENEEKKTKPKKDSEKEWIPVKDYIYTDENGLPIFKKKRYKIIDKETGEVSKATPFEDLINKRKNLDELTDEQKATLYNRVGIEEAKKEGKAIYITEGEKDADTLIAAGLIATCLKSPSEKIKDYHLKQLEGVKEAYILPDKDKPGIINAFNLHQAIKSTVKDIKVLVWNDEDIKADPESKEFAKWDITDQKEACNYTNEELLEFIENNSFKEFPHKYLDLIDNRISDLTTKEITKELKIKGLQWKSENKDNKGIPARAIARILRETCYFILLGYKSDRAPLAVYDTESGIYITSKRHMNMLIQAVEEVTINKQKEVYNQLITELYKENQFKQPFSDKDYSLFKNGVYNHKTRKLESFTPRKVFLSRINTNHNPNAEEPVFDDWSFSEWMDQITKGDYKKSLQIWQLFGTVIRPNYNNKTSFFIYDEKNNTGKSTFLRLLLNLVGEENTSALDLSQMEERFAPSTAENKALIIGDDNDRQYNIAKSNNFKRMVAGEYMNVEQKGKDGYQTKFNTTIVQSMNGLPDFKTVDKGLLSRIVIIRFDYQFSIDEKNTNVKDKYIENEQLLEYIAYKAIDVDIDNIVRTRENEELLHQLETSSNPVKAFYNEVVTKIIRKSRQVPPLILFKIFNNWTEFVLRKNITLDQKAFTTRIKEFFEDDGWTYKNSRLSDDVCMEELIDGWLEVREYDVDTAAAPATEKNNLKLFEQSYLRKIRERKQEKCFIGDPLIFKKREEEEERRLDLEYENTKDENSIF